MSTRPTPERLARLVRQARGALADNRARAQRLVKQIERWIPDRARRFPEIGQALAALKAPALYRALGHRSFAALLRSRRLATPATAARLIRIAQSLPAAQARTLGVEAAYAKASAAHPRRARGSVPATSATLTLKLGSNAARAALARLERRLHTRLRDGEASSWDVGKLFDELARGGHHHAAGYETLEAYADARFPEHGYRTLSRYRRVSLAFTRATAVRHGTQKLDLALRYIDATPAHERPAEIPRLRIAVPGVGPVAFARVTTKQLEAAVASMLETPAATVSLPRGAGTVVRTLERALTRGKAWPTRSPHLTTRVAKDSSGHVHALVTIHDVPIDSLARLARALTASAAPSATAGDL